jgi:iron complex transport system ATP-binding protein
MAPGNLNATPSAPALLLRAEGLSVGYRPGGRNAPPRAVLSGIDLELRAGELVCLLGPNGAGKSTLLRTLAGLQPPLAGRVTLDGADAASLSAEAWARKTAIVLTERMDAGNLTVEALASLGRHPHTGWSGRMREADRAAVRRGLEEAGAWELRDRLFDELSDGEKQRVMLARALAQEPALLLLDEPTAFLDLPRRVEAMRTLRALARERGRAVLLSTHDLDLALRAADRLWLIPAGGPVRTGVPEDLVLSGAFGKAFDQGDVVFDAATGQFRIHAHPTRAARLSGDALPVLWTARALERLGYAVSNESGEGAEASPENGGALRITARWIGGRAHWTCLPAGSDPASGKEFASLEALADHLKR